MTCTDERNCFRIDYLDPGVALSPIIDPSFENGLVCRPGPLPGMWDPDERVAVFSGIIHSTINTGLFTAATNIVLPIFVTLTAFNPSAIHPAIVYWAWRQRDSLIDADPGVQGAIAIQSSISPNPLIDVGYHVWLHNYDQRTSIQVPGAHIGYAQCPTTIAPGGSATIGFGYRFEGAGGAGTWSASVGRLTATAMMVVQP